MPPQNYTDLQTEYPVSPQCISLRTWQHLFFSFWSGNFISAHEIWASTLFKTLRQNRRTWMSLIQKVYSEKLSDHCIQRVNTEFIFQSDWLISCCFSWINGAFNCVPYHTCQNVQSITGTCSYKMFCLKPLSSKGFVYLLYSFFLYFEIGWFFLLFYWSLKNL